MVGMINQHQLDQEETDQEMAKVLILLTRDGDNKKHAPPPPAASRRVFECKSCRRQFASFQALGGHMASHKKTRVEGERDTPEAKSKVHGCSICGLEFAVGQALGGHMRRHRAAAEAEKKGVMWMDLNLTPMENDLANRSGCLH